jgi:plastocyanin
MSTMRTVTTTLLLLAAAAVNSVSAAPSSSLASGPSRTRGDSVVTHSITAGDGLAFSIPNVVANVGDTIEFHFKATNHSVAQAAFGAPCSPLPGGGGFFAGWNFAVSKGLPQSPNIVSLEVRDTAPMWYYCPQTVGSHCQNGMVGVINQNFSSSETIEAQIEMATKSTVSVSPETVQGGLVGANPNPDEGTS